MMSDVEFLIVTIGAAGYGYAMARAVDALRRLSERQRQREASRRAFLDAHRPRLHPGDMTRIQELAELEDLRDYIRGNDA